MTAATTVFTVGYPLQDSNEINVLPAGTVIGPDESEQYVRQPDGEWLRTWGDGTTTEYSGGFATGGYNKILRLASGLFIPPTPPPEPFDLYRWRFVDYVWHNVENNAVPGEHVLRALKRLGCDNMDPQPGMKVTSRQVIRDLPNGVLVAVGDPDDYPSYGLFAKKGYDPAHLLGPVTYWPNVGTVVQVGDRTDPPPLDPMDPSRIVEFNARAYDERVRVKRDTGWCPVFDQVMTKFGITAAVAKNIMLPFGVGMTVNRLQASALPLGTILGWGDSWDAFQWFARVAEGWPGRTAVAQTVRILGRRDDGTGLANSAATMRVLAVPDAEGFFRLDPPFGWTKEFWNMLPPGTTLDQDGARYVMCLGHRASDNTTPTRALYRRGSFDYHDFMHGSLTIVSFRTGA
jgi:hypothetical protein